MSHHLALSSYLRLLIFSPTCRCPAYNPNHRTTLPPPNPCFRIWWTIPQPLSSTLQLQPCGTPCPSTLLNRNDCPRIVIARTFIFAMDIAGQSIPPRVICRVKVSMKGC